MSNSIQLTRKQPTDFLNERPVQSNSDALDDRITQQTQKQFFDPLISTNFNDNPLDFSDSLDPLTPDDEELLQAARYVMVTEDDIAIAAPPHASKKTSMTDSPKGFKTPSIAIEPAKKTHKWTEEESDWLKLTVRQNPLASWATIARIMKTKFKEQNFQANMCSARIQNLKSLEDVKDSAKWPPEVLDLLAELHTKHPGDFVKIAQEMNQELGTSKFKKTLCQKVYTNIQQRRGVKKTCYTWTKTMNEALIECTSTSVTWFETSKKMTRLFDKPISEDACRNQRAKLQRMEKTMNDRNERSSLALPEDDNFFAELPDLDEWLKNTDMFAAGPGKRRRIDDSDTFAIEESGPLFPAENPLVGPEDLQGFLTPTHHIQPPSLTSTTPQSLHRLPTPRTLCARDWETHLSKEQFLAIYKEASDKFKSPLNNPKQRKLGGFWEYVAEQCSQSFPYSVTARQCSQYYQNSLSSRSQYIPWRTLVPDGTFFSIVDRAQKKLLTTPFIHCKAPTTISGKK
ncbi:MAG: hypothetical protein FJZ63_01180 [Chlamydiae bacterium]|nr:hypothetical protein [Chlamydiota bacterium]